MLKPTITVFLWLLLFNSTYSQKKKLPEHRLFQFSLLPAMGTNGLHPGGFINYFSFNLTSGYSASNRFIEVAGLSNINEIKTRGLQIAGVANLTGANAHAKLTPKQILKEDIEVEHNLDGGQFSGLVNYVANTVHGMQVTGGFNTVAGALYGLQIGGVSNTVKKYSFGVQIAGVYNISARYMNGTQLSTLFNFTKGALIGLQIGAVNMTGRTEGPNTVQNTDNPGTQIGLINKANKMNGHQIGLINFAGKSQGTMVGLINIYRVGGEANTNGPTAFGLLNVGDFGFVGIYADELFITNYQLALGNMKNGNYTQVHSRKYWLNSLTYGTTPDFLDDRKDWSVSYAVGKFFYFPVTVIPQTNQRHFVGGMGEIAHYNHGRKINESFNPIVKAKVYFGTRLSPKISNLYLMGGLSYNLYHAESANSLDNKWLQSEKNTSNETSQRWPGLFFGLQLH